MRKTSYWKLGDRYAYITSRGKRGIVDKLSQVPANAKTGSRAPTKKKGPKKSPAKPKRRKNTVAKKKTKKSSGMRLPGGIGPKAVLAGIGAMLLTPRLIPVATPGQTKLAAGMGLRFLKIGGGGPLAAVGIMETVAEMLLPRIGGFVPGGTGVNQTGYDY